MSLANALAFIRQVRQDPALRDALAMERTMEMLCALARRAGKPCDAAELSEAFVIEWGARQAYFQRRSAAKASEAGEPRSPPRARVG